MLKYILKETLFLGIKVVKICLILKRTPTSQDIIQHHATQSQAQCRCAFFIVALKSLYLLYVKCLIKNGIKES